MPLINYQVICSNPLTRETEFKSRVGQTNTTQQGCKSSRKCY